MPAQSWTPAGETVVGEWRWMREGERWTAEYPAWLALIKQGPEITWPEGQAGKGETNNVLLLFFLSFVRRIVWV
jgi:hypothetical protein